MPKPSRRAILRGAALFAALNGLPRAAGADAGPAEIDAATRLIQHLAQEAIRILATPAASLEQREAEFRGLLRQGFDLGFIGRFVLGANWRRFTPQQQADYQDLFAEFVLKSYARRLSAYSGETLQITGARPAGQQDVLVRTAIARPGGQPIVADWRVRLEAAGPHIIDVMVEGVSMAVAQRSEFGSVVASSGAEGLLQALRARTERVGQPAS